MGRLAMRPDEFWRATPREILDLNRGAQWRERREWERIAWLGSLVVSPHTKHPPSVRRLLSWLGPEDDAVERARTGAAKGGPEDKSPEGIQAFIDDIARGHKKHAWTMLSDKYAEPPEGNKDRDR